MTQIAILYWTGAGHTRKLAAAVADGATSTGATVDSIDIAALDASGWGRLHSADALIFGAPTFMGNVPGAYKMFMDETSDFWADLPWQDKIAAGFTVGSSPSGDKLNTLMTLAIFASQHAMIWVGPSEIGPPTRSDNADINRDGFLLGLAATSSRDKSRLIEDGDLETARRFGSRIATLTRRWGTAPSL